MKIEDKRKTKSTVCELDNILFSFSAQIFSLHQLYNLMFFFLAFFLSEDVDLLVES